MSGTGALYVPSHPSVRVPGLNLKGMGRGVWLAALALLGTGCGERAPTEPAPTTLTQQLGDEALKSAPAQPVGLALEVDNGIGIPLKVKAGQTFFINQVDLRASVPATVDEGVDGLGRAGDFASLDWRGTALADADPTFAPNSDGSNAFTRRRFFRTARWMQEPSLLIVQPVDAQGRPTGRAIPLNLGAEDNRKPTDDFFIRRMRAIQWTRDCRSATDCTGAHVFEEEALVEVRNARTGATPFTLSADTRALRVNWSARPGTPYEIPVEQVESSAWSYGFSIDITPVTPPRADGTYAPGSEVTFRMTFRDGAGKRLHPEGSLPTYNDFLLGRVDSGLQYYRGFFDGATTYYRRKHRECNLSASIIGPAQRIQPLRTIIEMSDFLGPEEAISIGTLERDGVFGQAMTVPPANKLFGGAFDPSHAGWAAPVSDTWTNKLPDNAEPGTYLVTVKARRVYLGEDVAASRTLEIQVGSPEHTQAKLTTGNCKSCHTQGGELNKVLHALDNRSTCATCHAPLAFELEGPVSVRTHFVHSRGRFDAPLQQCSTCHLSQESTQRTSKAACLSCHKSYPESHVKKFGPLQHMYVGGGRESFQQCTGACHTTHPGSGF